MYTRATWHTFKSEAKKKKKLTWKNFRYFFRKKISDILRRMVIKHEISYTPDTLGWMLTKRKVKKKFLIIIISRFLSLCNTFFYTQLAFVFHLPVDFCVVHDHMVALFLFLLKKDFHELFFVVFLYYLDNI